MISVSSWFVWRQSSQIFQHFLPFCFARSPNIHHLQQTLDWPRNINAIQKPLSGLKNVLQKPHNAFQGFRYRIYRASHKTWCRHVARFCHPSQTKRYTKQNSTRVKTMRVHSTMSRGRLMQESCRSVTLGSPLIIFHRGSYNNNSLQTFWQNLVIGVLTIWLQFLAVSALVGSVCHLSTGMYYVWIWSQEINFSLNVT
jgi:hypothetical protein